MSGPFGSYAWGTTYEQMHATMYRLKDNGPAPKSATDKQLIDMYNRAHYQYNFLEGTNQTMTTLGDRLRRELVGPEITESRRNDIIETLSSIDTLLSQTQRLEHQHNLLDHIADEINRRPWLTAHSNTEFADDAVETDTWTKVK